ncbi:MAG: glutamate racemase [Pseudohongiellaceae bacterium]
MSAAPIGVFDSGAGGLSILSGIRLLLPAENLLYVADTAHAPYGPKGAAYIRARSERILQFFLQRGVKAVVVACNTATTVAIADLRAHHELPIVGVEPAVKPAAALSRSGVVGVLATQGTISSDKFLHLKNRFNHQVEFITCPCPGLVQEIERLDPDPLTLRALLRAFIEPMLARGADTLVLGCTHYPLVRTELQAIAGNDVAVVDAGDAVARELQRRLAERGLLNAVAQEGQVTFFTSGDPAQQACLLGRYWNGPLQVWPLSP